MLGGQSVDEVKRRQGPLMVVPFHHAIESLRDGGGLKRPPAPQKACEG